MRYRDAAAFRQAPEQRLRTREAGDGARLARDRKRVAFDRLLALARLKETASDPWLLKGGFALDLRLAERARATRDVDIDWRAAEEELFETLIEAAALGADDHFTFQVERTGTPPERLGGSHRFRHRNPGRPTVRVLSARCRAAFRSVSVHDTLTTPDLLSFAGIDPVEVPTIPLERHIAEKLHAYARRYGDDQPSSRAKDLIDIVLMSELAPFEFNRLREVIVSLFEECDTRASRRRVRAAARVGASVSCACRGRRARSRPVGRTPPRRRIP